MSALQTLERLEGLAKAAPPGQWEAEPGTRLIHTQARIISAPDGLGPVCYASDSVAAYIEAMSPAIALKLVAALALCKTALLLEATNNPLPETAAALAAIAALDDRGDSMTAAIRNLSSTPSPSADLANKD